MLIGYYTGGNYMGLIPNTQNYMRFENEQAHKEYVQEMERTNTETSFSFADTLSKAHEKYN